MGYAPVAAEGEGDAVAREVDLGDIVSMMVSGVQSATPQPSRGTNPEPLRSGSVRKNYTFIGLFLG